MWDRVRGWGLRVRFEGKGEGINDNNKELKCQPHFLAFVGAFIFFLVNAHIILPIIEGSIKSYTRIFFV